MKPSSLTVVYSAEPGELYREDVRAALTKAAWREDSRGQLVAANGTVWVETNDALDSGIDSPDKSWSVAFDSDVPAVVIVAAALASAGQTADRHQAATQSRTMLDHARDVLRARMSKDDLRLVLENVITYAAHLEAELEQARRGETGGAR